MYRNTSKMIMLALGCNTNFPSHVFTRAYNIHVGKSKILKEKFSQPSVIPCLPLRLVYWACIIYILSVLIFYVPFFIYTSSLADFISSSRSHCPSKRNLFYYNTHTHTKRIFVFIWLQTFVMWTWTVHKNSLDFTL